MTVAKLGRSSSSGPRFAALRHVLRQVVGPTFFILAIATLVFVAGAGGYLARTNEVGRLDRQFAVLAAGVGNNNDAADAATARVVELAAENLRLAAELDASNDLSVDLAERLANVESAVRSTVDLETSFEALVIERDELRDSLSETSSAFEAQTDRLSELTPIESFGPVGSPLLWDESTTAWVTQPVCTGSMEPTIGCEDLLVVYRPGITDLDVGDIIIFQRPGPNCQGFVPGGFLLHRITRVVSSPTDGLAFETKGDANFSIDPCRAPVSTVTGKVLAIIKNSRLPG